MVDADRTKSYGFWGILVAFFSGLSKGTWKKGPQTAGSDISRRSDKKSEASPLSAAPLDATPSPIKISSQPEMIPESQKSQYSDSRKSSADDSCQMVRPSLGFDLKRVRINTNQRASKIGFPPTSASPTSTYDTLSPSTLFSEFAPNSLGRSRRAGSYPSPIIKEYTQSLDLSLQITLTDSSPMFEGTYSDVYKGNYQGQEAGSLLMWLIGT